MATVSSFSPNQNPNSSSNFTSPMIQPFTDHHHEVMQPDPPSDHDPPYDAVPSSAHRDSSPTPTNPTPTITNPNPIKLLHVSFNQDHGCFAAGTDRGFRIYNCDPFREIFRRDFDGNGGVAAVQMLFRSNILALVGGGDTPQYRPNKVMIWDDHKNRCIGELSFRSEVRGIRLRRDRIVAVLEQKIYVYNFLDLKLLHQIETVANPKGLCEVSQADDSFVLVCPGLLKGQIRAEHYASKRTKFIMAHDSTIACFALSQDGKLLATASSKGTLVRVFNTYDGTLLQEVRRGADRAEIHSLAFSDSAEWLAVSSDKGTVHVFDLKVNTRQFDRDRSNSPVGSPSSSSLSFIKERIPAPANYLVISGDDALTFALNSLHSRNYNILAAHPHCGVHSALVATASCVWDFPCLIRGGPPYNVRKNMVPRCSFDFSKLSLKDAGRCQTRPDQDRESWLLKWCPKPATAEQIRIV